MNQPQHTSTTLLPRRYLSSSDQVRYATPVTPAHLSPIKTAAAGLAQRNNFFREEPTLHDSSVFQHYSVDASRAILPVTPGNHLPEPNFESVQLHVAAPNTASFYASPRRQLIYDDVPPVTSPQLETFRPSTPRNNPHAIKPEVLPPRASAPENRYSAASSFARAFTVEGCRRCGKAFPFADQSVDDLHDIDLDYCSCTLMGALQQSYNSEDDVTSASDMFALDSLRREAASPTVGGAKASKQLLRDIPITPSVNTQMPRQFVFV